MNINELAAILHSAYYNAPDGAKVTAGLLFGVRYANELGHMKISDLEELTIKVGIPQGYKSEINKGIKLAEYVELDTARLWFGND